MQPLRLEYSPTKDLAASRLFTSALVRWLWGLYTQRLTRAGRWLLWPTCFYVGYAGLSLRVQGYVVFSYLFALWAVSLVAMLLLRPRVLLAARHADRICAGEVLPIDVEIEQVGRMGGAELLVLPHDLPPQVDAVPDQAVAVEPLSAGQKARLRLALRCQRRGVYRLKGFRVESDFPVGLVCARRVFAEDRQLVVYPRFRPLARLQLPTGRRYHPGGVALASSIGESFEFIGNREYREGDNVRDIDWRATARLSRPIVREYRDEYFLRVAVILDTHVAKGAGSGPRDAFERAVSLSASISDYMARQEYLVDLFAAGPNLYHLTAGRSLAYLDQILDILACVEENPAEPFEIIEPQILEYLSRITTIICIFLDWNETRRAFVQRLSRQGAGVKVIVVREGDCTLNPIAESDELGYIPVLSKSDFDGGIEEL